MLLRRLQTEVTGLTAAAAQERLAHDGPNSTRVSAIRPLVTELLRASLNPLNLILLAAGIAAAVLGQIPDAAIIASIVLLSTGLYFWQSFRSSHAVHQLQRSIAPTAAVLRDGSWTQVPRECLVCGDVIQLAAGDLVPADARLLESVDLHVQQSALTGESLPAEKMATPRPGCANDSDYPNIVFLGTSIVSGSAKAVVFATGAHTAFGEIVDRLAGRPAETEFERGARRFALLIVRTMIVLVAFVLIANLTMGRNAFQSLLFSVALAVGLTPEFLPMITTVTLAQGALRMARQKVIVKHLPAIQNLGSIDVLCTDKTGTLTVGSMAVQESLDPLGRLSSRARELAYLNSHFQTGLRSPLDEAILGSPAPDLGNFVKTDEIPFDFERRCLSVVLRQGATFLLIAKGAPERVFSLCRNYEAADGVHVLDEQVSQGCMQAFHMLSGRGLRVLAVAYKSVDHPEGFRPADECDLTLAGFVTFSDPVLPGVADCLRQLASDGVRVKILSGDNELVTGYVCSQAGLTADRVVLGSEIALMDELALARTVEQCDVFARLSPMQKHRIVRTLATHGHVVGFMGDGINDAPSLHGADVGISVAGAVDIAREAADIILLEPRLDVLHAGIVAGRRSFGNVLKYLMMGTSSNFGNMLSMAAATVWLPFLPMRATQILLNNFLYDLAQITIPTDHVDPELVRRPQQWDMSLIRDFMIVIGPISSAYDFLTFAVLLYGFGFTESGFQSGWFLESLTTQTLVLFVIRTLGRPWRSTPSVALTVTTLLAVAGGTLLLYTPAAAYFGMQPLPAGFFIYLAVITVTYLWIVEIVKERLVRKLSRRSRLPSLAV
ncbi:MAG TPA: magnesium-translocating P-type ATPase [Steroidobacteraceae bacterium]|nr:magnesium-translocating P-type ATPase [Steroidobacteraceae bacterium]